MIAALLANAATVVGLLARSALPDSLRSDYQRAVRKRARSLTP